MNRHFILMPLVCTLTWTQALATDLRLSPLDVISLNGQLNARDGIMTYTLTKDGSFSSFPLAMSGTWVQGKWKLESSSKGLTVQVEGTWGGVNQISPKDNFMTMKLVIHTGILQDTSHPETDIYKCSVTVEDMKYEYHAVPLKITPLPPGKMTVGGSDSNSP